MCKGNGEKVPGGAGSWVTGLMGLSGPLQAALTPRPAWRLVPAGSRQQSGACTGHRAAWHVSHSQRS